jgi:hypothetical protein
MEGLGAQKILNLYSLDYPTITIESNPNNRKNTLNSILCSKKTPRKHMVGHLLAFMYSHMVKTNQIGGIGPKNFLSSKKKPNTPKKTTTTNNTRRKGITSNIAPNITFPKTHQLISLLFSQSTPL